jgi:hypothetical protein
MEKFKRWLNGHTSKGKTGMTDYQGKMGIRHSMMVAIHVIIEEKKVKMCRRE